jgi:hypothetical protein
MRRWWIVLTAMALLVAGLVTWLVWPGGGEPPPRERVYRDFTACLLTDDKGLTGDPAKAVWDGMQHASVANAVRVQYLAISGAQTAENGAPYFNSLAQQKCAVIIAAGKVPVGAMMTGKARFPDIRYVAVGATADASVTTVESGASDVISATVDSLITKAARG